MTKKYRFEKSPSLHMKSYNKAKNPLVSIITVCYNSEKTIAKTIESVLNQTCSNLEYLIIDGLSTDGTLDIIQRYEPKFKGRLKWISEKDAGIYDAMNKGINFVKGQIVGIINSDDWYELNTVELVVNSYRTYGEGVHYGILRIMENGVEVMLKVVNYRFLYREDVGHAAYFVASNIYRTYGIFKTDYRFASDFELMMRYIQNNVPFIQINNILATFNREGLSTQHNLETWEEYLRIRYKFGYLTKNELFLRIVKYKLLRTVRKYSGVYTKVLKYLFIKN